MKMYTINPKKIRCFKLLLSLSITLIVFFIAIPMLIDIRLVAILPAASMPLVYLLYYCFYLSKCRIVIDFSNNELVVIKPFKKRTFRIDDVHFDVRRFGVRSITYIIRVLNDSNRVIIKVDSDNWENVKYICYMRHESNSIIKDFKTWCM